MISDFGRNNYLIAEWRVLTVSKFDGKRTQLCHFVFTENRYWLPIFGINIYWLLIFGPKLINICLAKIYLF